jgi:hypothetical protein
MAARPPRAGGAQGPDDDSTGNTRSHLLQSADKRASVFVAATSRLQKPATWIVAEGSERGKHLKSIFIEKAMDDCLVAYDTRGSTRSGVETLLMAQ